MIRMMTAVLLAAALCMTGAAFAEAAPAVTAEDYLGSWTDLNGIRHIRIEAREEDGGYIAMVRMDTWSEGAYGSLIWAYGCVYDEEAHALKSLSRVTAVGGEDPDGEEEITDTDFDFDGASFFFDEAGMLVWEDDAEGLDDGMVFRPAEEEADPDGAAGESA